MTGENFRAKLLLQQANSLVELLGAGGSRSGTEGLGGEAGGVKVGGEKHGEDGIGRERVERRSGRRRRREFFEGG